MQFFANTDPSTLPYVYFRSQRLISASVTVSGQYEYGYVLPSTSLFYPFSHPAYDSANAAADYAVPYLDQPINTGVNTPSTTRAWRNQDSFQILFAGFDNLFGSNAANFRFTRIGQELPRTVGSSTAATLAEGNFDNITNFTQGTIEEEMQ